MSGRVLAIRHVQFEDLGSFAPWFAQSGLQVEYLDAGVDALAGVDVLSPALVEVLDETERGAGGFGHTGKK
jgi:GMP synthase (glutamine-hydrolysing)